MKTNRPVRLLSVLIAAVAATSGSTVIAAEVRPSRAIALREAIEQALARNFDVRIDRQSELLSETQLASARAAYVPTATFGATWDRSNDPLRSTTTSTTLGATTSSTVSWIGGVSAALPSGGTVAFNYSLADANTSESLLGGSTTNYDTARGALGVVSITQPLLKGLRTDSTRLSIRQRQLDVRSSRLGTLAGAIDTVAGVEQAYFQLIAARETVNVRQAAVTLAERTVTDTRTRRQLGTVAALDEKQALSSVASAEADLIAARQTVRERENALKLLVVDDFATQREAEWVPSDSLSSAAVDLDYASSVSRALQARPDLQQLDVAVAQRDLDVDYRRDQRLPSVGLVGSYGLNGSDTRSSGVVSQWRNRDYPAYSAGVQISFPWTNRKSRAELHGAEAQKRQAELRVSQLRDTIRSQVDSALTAVRSTHERLDATRRARDYAEAALAAEQEKLNAGQSTTFNVLQLQRDLTSARASEIAALADYNVAASTLRRREASTLDHWQIAFDATAPVAGKARPSS